MSTTIARRLDRVEGDHLAAAITHFADHCHGVFTAADPADAADPEGGEESPFTLALGPVIELAATNPTEQHGIRAALATVAPFVGLTAMDSPLVILATLEDVIASPRAAAWD